MSYLDTYCAKVRDWEGNVTYLYLDSDNPANPTTGNGYLVPSLEVSQTLAWLASDGSAATAEQIAADWARVGALPGNRLVSFYRCAESLVLAQASVDALTLDKVQGFDSDLRKMIPAYYTFPDSAKIGLLDMAMNLGIGRPAQNGRPATGLHAYQHFLAAVNATPPEWNTAAAQCGRNTANPAFAARNAWTAEQFQAAAQAE
jgi:hypothetical protein